MWLLLLPLCLIVSTSTAVSDNPSQSSDTQCSDQKETLQLTNSYRKKHGAQELQWNSSLAAAAAGLAEELGSQQCDSWYQARDISSTRDAAIGFNVFYLQSSRVLANTSCVTAVQNWYSESRLYDWDQTRRNWDNIQNIGHFSLMIWGDTTSLGCSQVQCSSAKYLVVCGYYPAGNLLMQSVWERNVQSDEGGTPPPDAGRSGVSGGRGRNQSDAQIELPPPPPSRTSQNMDSSRCPDPSATLDSHNMYRQKHGLAPLVWNTSLVASSQKWAAVLEGTGCRRLYHSHYNGIGENLYSMWVTGALLKNTSCLTAVAPWYNEISLYNWDDPQANWEPQQFEKVGHFTQIIWKDTTDVGCTNAECDGSTAYVVVCQYYPQGNIIGDVDLWNENILPLKGTDVAG